MTDIKKDLDLAHKIIEHTAKYRDYYGLFYKMWPFATINMKEYLEPYNLENKTCLTIQGSSDHIFEIYLKNPKKIIGVDTNPLTQYLFYLKQAAFSVLENSKEYLKFFRWFDYPCIGSYNYSAFNKDVYKEIEKNLQGNGYIFWHELFENYRSIDIRRNLFNQVDEKKSNILYQALNYLTDENYQYIRNNYNNINYEFINEDIRNLSSKLTENCDFMTLSNLIIYAEDMFKIESLQKFKEVVENLSTKLNQDGVIIVGYFYDIEDKHALCAINQSEIRNKVFKEPQYSYQYINQFVYLDLIREEPVWHDACLVYRKK